MAYKHLTKIWVFVGWQLRILLISQFIHNHFESNWIESNLDVYVCVRLISVSWIFEIILYQHWCGLCSIKNSTIAQSIVKWEHKLESIPRAHSHEYGRIVVHACTVHNAHTWGSTWTIQMGRLMNTFILLSLFPWVFLSPTTPIVCLTSIDRNNKWNAIERRAMCTHSHVTPNWIASRQ